MDNEYKDTERVYVPVLDAEAMSNEWQKKITEGIDSIIDEIYERVLRDLGIYSNFVKSDVNGLLTTPGDELLQAFIGRYVTENEVENDYSLDAMYHYFDGIIDSIVDRIYAEIHRKALEEALHGDNHAQDRGMD